MIKYIPYIRVSGDRQVKEGHGLEGQDKRCKDFGKHRGYIYDRSFSDEGVSGGIIDRPGMQALLNYLDACQDDANEYVIIIDDIKRLARDVQGHFTLKTAICSRGARIESPNHQFDDSPEGKFVETILAGAAELERNQNKRQVLQKMKARMELGYWSMPSPIGLQMVKDAVHGKLLGLKEPYSSIYKAGIEDFRDGLLQTIEDFRHFILSKYKEHGITKKLSSSGARGILTEILYAGWIKYDKWNIPLRQGKHQGFISLDTFNIVQDKLNKKARPWKRNDYRADFALRGHILCDNCGKELTASWNKGRTKSYANYWCRTAGCANRYKTISKGKIDPDFEAFLSQKKLTDEVLDLANEVLNEQWAIKAGSYHETKVQDQTEINVLDQQIKNFLKRVGNTSDDDLVESYEQQIKELKQNKRLLENQLKENYYTQNDFGTASDLVFKALKYPIKLWQSDDYNDKRSIILMYFEDQLRYNLNQGFGTTSLAIPIELIEENFSTGSLDVGCQGFEP